MLHYILRLDDICPRMNWEKFEGVRKAIDRNNIKPIIGVIPDNKDEVLMLDAPEPNFWDLVRGYQDNGWTIAQHGFEHLYHTKSGGIFQLSKQGEFAGLPMKVQSSKLQAGRKILQAQGVESDIFMAPSHSMDENTIAALKATDFKYVTDGYALYPYRYNGLTFVPQLFESGLHFGFGIYTMCLHTNEMNESQIKELAQFLDKNADKFISFSRSYQYADNGLLNTKLYNSIFRLLRKGKNWIDN